MPPVLHGWKYSFLISNEGLYLRMLVVHKSLLICRWPSQTPWLCSAGTLHSTVPHQPHLWQHSLLEPIFNRMQIFITEDLAVDFLWLQKQTKHCSKCKRHKELKAKVQRTKFIMSWHMMLPLCKQVNFGREERNEKWTSESGILDWEKLHWTWSNARAILC